MRRLAAVFASKRSDKSDAASFTAPSTSVASPTTDATQQTTKPSSSKRFLRSFSRKTTKPVDPVVNRLSRDLHPPSSSSSSSGAPTTPDDDHGSLLRAPVHKSWLSLPPVDHRLGSFHHLEPNPNDPTRFLAPPRPTASPSTLDTEDDSSDESSLAPDLSQPPERPAPFSAPEYVLTLTSNNLRPPYAPPPLLHIPGCPSFPRSSNVSRSLPYADSLETTLHRNKLHRRLNRGDLSPSETRSLAVFAGKRVPPKDRLSLHMDDIAVCRGRVQSHSVGLRRWADRPCFEDRLLVLLAENLPATPNGEPLWTRVSPATGFGVAALEYSMALELLAGLYEDDLPRQPERQAQLPEASASSHLHLDTQLSLHLGPSLTQSLSTISPSSTLGPPSTATTPSSPLTAAVPPPKSASPIVPPPQSRNSMYKASPSPLRMEAASASPPSRESILVSPLASAASTAVNSPTNPPSTAASPPTSASSAQTPLKSALKHGVRFAEKEKEKEDQIPLGYVMRIKNKREEKVRFLQVERERRKHEEERRRHEDEKRKWEEERAIWEREKRAMEEERKKKLYADEVAAARSRRESQRFGSGVTTGNGLATGQWDRGERPRPEREGSSSSYTRPAYDHAAHSAMPPRQNSDFSLALPKSSRQGSASGSGSGSPADSRPNSVYGSGSRPPSMHSGVPTPSSSQQDVRTREHRMSGSGSRRGSIVSETGGSWRRSEHVSVPSLPVVWPMGVNMNVPAVPMSAMHMAMPMQMLQMPMQMPMYGMPMDMPLLPPSAPFMQSYGQRSPSSSRPHSPQRSQSSSPTLGRQSLPASESSERVNRMSQQPRSASTPRAPSLPRSESSPRPNPTRAHHQRTSSGGDIPQRPVNRRSQVEDKRGATAKVTAPRVTSPSSSSLHRPNPIPGASIPSHPPPAFSQARSSWALTQPGFQNLSRPNAGRRQTVIS